MPTKTLRSLLLEEASAPGVPAELSARVLHYLEHGADFPACDEAARDVGWGEAFWRRVTRCPVEECPRIALLRQLDRLSPKTAVRLGHWFAALAQARSSTGMLLGRPPVRWFGEEVWLTELLRELVAANHRLRGHAPALRVDATVFEAALASAGADPALFIVAGVRNALTSDCDRMLARAQGEILGLPAALERHASAVAKVAGSREPAQSEPLRRLLRKSALAGAAGATPTDQTRPAGFDEPLPAPVRAAFEQALRTLGPQVESEADAFLGFIVGEMDQPRPAPRRDLLRQLTPRCGEFIRHPATLPAHFVRLLTFSGCLLDEATHDVETFGYPIASEVSQYLASHPEQDLLSLSHALAFIGLEPADLARSLVTGVLGEPTLEGEIEFAQQVTFWQAYPSLLDEYLSRPEGIYAASFVNAAVWVLNRLPEVPGALREPLREKAFGTAPKARAAAQACLGRDPDTRAWIEPHLQSPSPTVRRYAAEWLGQLRAIAAAPALETALAAESDELARAALLHALEQLGQDVSRFFDLSALIAKASKTSVPKDLAWFPFAQLPTVRWRDGRGEAPPALLRHWVIEAFRLKQPEPGPMLRHYAKLLEERDREACGEFVLAAWLAQDQQPISLAEAEAGARAEATSLHAYASYSSTPDWSFEQFFAAALSRWSQRPAANALPSKGVLALAAAWGGRGLVPPVRKYLKDWYGNRAAQCLTLLRALGWVENVVAAQFLLSISGGFRTKSIQNEAGKVLRALAERKGWTTLELADRTAPTLGFEEGGRLELDYGPRQFVARITPDLAIVLAESGGKPLKALPEPRQSDDAELAAAAKKQLSAAKKDWKDFLKAQTRRLHEAMCVQREWDFPDWEAFLQRHPLVGLLAQRLVWAVLAEGRQTRLFRPLADGTLTDANDEVATCGPADRIVLAHGSQIAPELGRAWAGHLADYEVTPLFPQVLQGALALTEEQARSTRWLECSGHRIDGSRLRTQSAKLGYQNDSTRDGGCVYAQVRDFPSVGLRAWLEHDGIPVYQAPTGPVDLHGLQFSKISRRADPPPVELGSVPPVLLAECAHDLRQLAAAGSGSLPGRPKNSV